MIEIQDIKKKIKNGEIFFISDFAELDNYEAVRKTLQRLTKAGEIGRIAKGIYFLPRNHPRFGTIYPHAEQIAQAIAKRDKARIIATGSTALNLLGLSTQIPMKSVFLTDGSPRTIKAGKQTIQFKKTSTKNLSIDHRMTNLIIQALKAIGEKYITQEQISQIQTIIKQSDEKELIYQYLKAAPVWIQKKITSK